MDQNQTPPLFQLNLDANNGYTLRSAASWGKVLGIAGVILSLIFFAFAFLFQNMMGRTGGYYGEDFGGSTKMAGQMGMIIYILVGLLYLIGSLFAVNFGNRITKALKTNDQNSLNSGFSALRNYFAFWSILLIIALLFMLIAIVTMAAAPSYS
jgi:hypothetical protein